MLVSKSCGLCHDRQDEQDDDALLSERPRRQCACGDGRRREGGAGEPLLSIRTATECPSWNNASDNYIKSQASYAAGRLNDYGYSDNLIPRNTVQRLNKAFEGYATFELNNNNVSVFNLLKECVVLGNRKK